MNKKISVVMSTYNEPVEWVEKSIRSILNQTYDNIEVIVICDNPDNKGIVDLLNLIKEGDNRVVLHFNERNKGLIYSLNKAINLSSGEYIARMDADDISLPTRLSEQILYLEENHLDLCGCNALLFSEHGNLGLTNKLNSHEALEKLMVAGDIGIIHPTFLARRKVFVESGGYNPLALHAEDMEFIAHILSMGFRLGNNPKVLFKYRFSTNSVTRRNAFHLYTTISNINKAYKSFKNGGDYIFVNSIKFNKIKEERYSMNKILMTEAREKLVRKNYFGFLYKIILSFIYSPKLFYHTIKITYIVHKLKKWEK